MINSNNLQKPSLSASNGVKNLSIGSTKGKKSTSWLGRCISYIRNAAKGFAQAITKTYHFAIDLLFCKCKKPQTSKVELSASKSQPDEDDFTDFENEEIAVKKNEKGNSGKSNKKISVLSSDAEVAKMMQEEFDLQHAQNLQFGHDPLEDEELAKKLQNEINADQTPDQNLVDLDLENQDTEISRLLEKEFALKNSQKDKGKPAGKEPPKKVENDKTNIPKKNKQASNPVQTNKLKQDELEKMQKIQSATTQILKTEGLIAVQVNEEKNNPKSKKIILHELQGGGLRAVVATATKEFPEAISPAAMRAQRQVNFEQYLAMKFKQFSHIEEVEGRIPLPSGKLIALEGFFEEFAIPMVISSYNEYSKNSTFFAEKDKEWILSEFNKIIYCDYVSKKEVQNIVTTLQDPNFKGPMIVQTGFSGHCAAVMFFGDYLFYADRGCSSTEPGTSIFRIPNRELITENFVSGLMNRKDIKQKEYHMLENILTELNAEQVHYEKAPAQKVGNCTHATMNTILNDLMAVRYLLNKKDIQLKKLTKKDWSEAFSKVKPEHKKCTDAERKVIFDDMISEIEEWLAQNTDIASHKLKKTYEDLLTCWLYTANTVREPSAEKKVKELLNQLQSVK